MSIAEHDRPRLDTVGHAMFLLSLAAVGAAIAAVIHPHGLAPRVLAGIVGVYLGLVITTCFLRGYRRQRDYYATVTAPLVLTEDDEAAVEELLQ